MHYDDDDNGEHEPTRLTGKRTASRGGSQRRSAPADDKAPRVHQPHGQSDEICGRTDRNSMREDDAGSPMARPALQPSREGRKRWGLGLAQVSGSASETNVWSGDDQPQRPTHTTCVDTGEGPDRPAGDGGRCHHHDGGGALRRPPDTLLWSSRRWRRERRWSWKSDSDGGRGGLGVEE